MMLHSSTSEEKRGDVMRPTSSSTSAAGDGELHNPPLVKRKRTKRPRHHQHHPASSSESTTTEEEDMAHCLILLAAGGAADVDSKPSPSPAQQQQAAPPPTTPAAIKSGERYTSRKYTEAVATADGVKAGFYVYECKTCNKCFPTFQALGGHRASHKKPRLSAAAGVDDAINNNLKASPTTTWSPPRPPLVQMADVVTTALSLNSCGAIISSSNNKQLRVHECSICGAEFASGQALGGHMRRHRPLNAPPVTAIANKEGINLPELDLNLPAPEEAVVSSAVVLGLGQFTDPGNKSAGLVLTASPLVDCHY